jgi:transcriptional regulator with XRE-family HTH domain
MHRASRGLTQEELADLSALSVRAIADIERGRTVRPYRRSVQRLADALDLTGSERDEFERVARWPAAMLQAARPDQRLPGAVRTAMASVSPLPYLPAQLDEVGLLTSLLLALAGAGGTLTVSAGATDAAGRHTLALHWAGEPSDRGAGRQLHIDVTGLLSVGPRGERAQALRDVLRIMLCPPASPATPAGTTGARASASGAV